jgi:hypothetical protein
MAGEYLAEVGSEEESMSETSKVESYWLGELGLRLVDTPGFSDSRGRLNDFEIMFDVFYYLRRLNFEVNRRQGGLDGVLVFESCLEKVPKINRTFELIEMTFGDEAKQSTLCMLTDCS